MVKYCCPKCGNRVAVGVRTVGAPVCNNPKHPQRKPIQMEEKK